MSTVPYKYEDEAETLALKVSPAVVSLRSHSGKKELFLCSGTIMECEQNNTNFMSSILTSASLVRHPSGKAVLARNITVEVYLSDGKKLDGKVFKYDLHYNLALIKVKSEEPLPIAAFRYLDESMPITRETMGNPGSFQLCPGDMVIALGRSFVSHSVVVESGAFSIDCCRFDCQELCMATCRIARFLIGGPLINLDGDVIGINFYHDKFTPFLPINVAFRCLEKLKKYGEVNPTWLGMILTNFYAGNLAILDIISRKFPNVQGGAIVEEVKKGSPAFDAGLLPNDVIIWCNGCTVGCPLEFCKAMWENVEGSMEVVVMRASSDRCLKLIMVVDKSNPNRYNSWSIPRHTGVYFGGLPVENWKKRKIN